MHRSATIVIAAISAAATSAATAAIGDNYVRVVYCSASDGGEHVYYGAGTCAHAKKVLAMFGHTFKECQQLVVVGGGTIAGHYGDILENPHKILFGGELVNVGQVGQGVVIIWRPDGLPHAIRSGPQGLEIAPLPLPHAPNGSDLENFIVARAGQPTRWIDDTIIQGIQGNFEIIYQTPTTGSSPERTPFTFNTLQFTTAQLPCNPADLTPQYNVLDLADINAFINGFVSMDPSVDLNGDLILDLTDINLFIGSFTGGCP